MIDIELYTARMFKATRADFRREKLGEKGSSVTVAHCNTFRLFMVNIVLPWPNYVQKIRLATYIKTM